jgi:hypothetical protein
MSLWDRHSTQRCDPLSCWYCLHDWHATHVTLTPHDKWLEEVHLSIGRKEIERIRKNPPTKAPNSPVEPLSEGE